MARLLLTASHLPPRLGGVERYVDELSRGLAGRGHEVVVVTTSPEGLTDRVADGVRIVGLPVWRTLSNTPLHPGWLLAVRRVIAEVRPHVLNTHAPVIGLSDVASLVRGRVPLVATYHAGSMRKGDRSGVDLVIGAYERTALRLEHASASAVVTTFPGRTLGSAGRSHFVPPGIDPERFRPVPTNDDPPTILYVGRIERSSAWKGVATLVEAMVRVVQAAPTARLRLVGDGDAVADHVAHAARLGIGDHLEVEGPLTGEALTEAYAQAALLVLPSHTEAEAFGMVLIEALACGTAVIGTEVGGPPHVIADTGGGVTVRPADAGALADAILALLADEPRRRQLARNGRAAVLSRYTWSRAVDRYEEIFDRAYRRR